MTIRFPEQCFRNATVYVQRLTYPFPVQIDITIDNQTLKSVDTSAKMKFTEATLPLSESVCADTIQITRTKTDDWLLKRLPLEIDWIEVEEKVQ